MNRNAVHLSVASAIASTILLSSSVLARPLESVETADGVRLNFVQAGLQTEAPTTWWMNGETTFTARDASHDRIVIVFVYPSLEAAQAEHRKAVVRDAGMPREHPHLVPGYGPSEWRGNVAMVQASLSELVRLYNSQVDDGAMAVVVRGDDRNADGLTMWSLSSGATVDSDLVAILTPAMTEDL